MQTKIILLIFTNLLFLLIFLPNFSLPHVGLIFSLVLFNLGYFYIEENKKEPESKIENSEIDDLEKEIKLERLKTEHTLAMVKQEETRTKLNNLRKPKELFKEDRKPRF